MYHTDLDDLGFILGLILLPPLALVVIFAYIMSFLFNSLILTLITTIVFFFSLIYLLQKFNLFSFLADSFREFLGVS
ncbi:MAG: hypothetical protein GPJ54_06130 [Candidatus Heimdallarchaeota archaeon]|nr:hypothetical protein [Candidatus Heimdallarchaeota archaeon]